MGHQRECCAMPSAQCSHRDEEARYHTYTSIADSRRLTVMREGRNREQAYLCSGVFGTRLGTGSIRFSSAAVKRKARLWVVLVAGELWYTGGITERPMTRSEACDGTN